MQSISTSQEEQRKSGVKKTLKNGHRSRPLTTNQKRKKAKAKPIGTQYTSPTRDLKSALMVQDFEASSAKGSGERVDPIIKFYSKIQSMKKARKQD